MKLLTETSKHVNEIKRNVDEMIDARRKGNKIENSREKAIFYCDNVKPYFDTLKYHA